MIQTLLAILTTTTTTVVRDSVIEWGHAALGVTAIATLIAGIFRYFVLRPLDNRIKEATKQIQPNANGGQSLADVNKKVDALTDTVEEVVSRLDRMEERHDELFKVLLAAQARVKARRSAQDKDAA